MDEQEYGLLVPFVDQSESFALGFEAGRFWEQMEARREIHGEMLHAKNREQFEMFCRRFHYEVEFVDINNEWLGVDAKPRCGLN